MQENSQCKTLIRINEVNEFVSQSINRVDEILRSKNSYNFKLENILTPMTLNVHRAIEAIGKFHMNHPLDNNAPSFLKLNK